MVSAVQAPPLGGPDIKPQSIESVIEEVNGSYGHPPKTGEEAIAMCGHNIILRAEGQTRTSSQLAGFERPRKRPHGRSKRTRDLIK